MASQESQNSSISARVSSIMFRPLIRWRVRRRGSTSRRSARRRAATRPDAHRGGPPRRRPRRSRRPRGPRPGTAGVPGTGSYPRRPSSGGPPAITDAAWLLELDDHLRVVVAVGLRALCHPELEVAQDDREDRLQLHHRERVAYAAMLAGAERYPGPAVLEVLLTRVDVASGVELGGLRKILLDPVGHPRRGGDHGALRDDVAEQVEVLLHQP